jgi:hypothetical protein
MRKPYWHKTRKQWYVWHNDKQVGLGPDKDAAINKWHRLKSLASPDSPDVQVFVIVEQFLTWADRSLSAAGVDYYTTPLQSFSELYWDKPTPDLRPHHVTASRSNC